MCDEGDNDDDDEDEDGVLLLETSTAAWRAGVKVDPPSCSSSSSTTTNFHRHPKQRTLNRLERPRDGFGVTIGTSGTERERKRKKFYQANNKFYNQQSLRRNAQGEGER